MSKKKAQVEAQPDYPEVLVFMDAAQTRKALEELIVKPLALLRLHQDTVGQQQQLVYGYRTRPDEHPNIDPFKALAESYNLLVKETLLTHAVGLQHFHNGEFGDAEVEYLLEEWKGLAEDYSATRHKMQQEYVAAKWREDAPKSEVGRYVAEHVPVEIARMLSQGGPSAQDACDAALYARWVGLRGEVLVEGAYLTSRQQKVKQMLLPMMARSIAYLSFAYGGVDMYGQHFEAIPGGGWKC